MHSNLSRNAGLVSEARWDSPFSTRRSLFAFLISISLFLIVVSFVVPTLGIDFFQGGREGHRLLDVSFEANIPTWWSAMMLGVSGLAFIVHARATSAMRGWKVGIPAGIIGLILVLLSMDDMSGIHENLFRLGQYIAPNFFAYNWLFLGIPLGIAVLTVSAFALVKLPGDQRKLVALGLVVFFSGALGLELVGSYMATHDLHLSTIGKILYHVEEFLEMCGAALLVVAALSTPGVPVNTSIADGNRQDSALDA